MVKAKESKKDNNPEGPAISKRLKINKVRQQTMLTVLIASVFVGVVLVLSWHFIKTINFYEKVISAKDDALENYQDVILNSGACQSSIDADKNDILSISELAKCDPDSVDATSVPNTLRYNVMVTMANNYDLETVARDATTVCYNEKGKKYNFQELYDMVEPGETVNGTYVADETAAETLRATYLSMLKMCSSLRVISEAMPTAENDEALMSSLNQIFIISEFDPDGLSPANGYANSNSNILTAIPVSLSVESTTEQTRLVLSNIEKSIRPFNILTATISWSGTERLELTASAISYYVNTSSLIETTTTVKASNSK